ncbi:MAG: YihY/virulence factor BrkB family protein [Acidobacteria bacterium]|nr:MAG: YihY/virulence factor BrkB family protein [Acidobacteriota bacterium]
MARLVQTLRYYGQAARRGLVEFYNSDNLTFASSIAYYSLLSMFPFLLLVLAVLGRVTVGDRDATLLQLISQAVPGHLDFLFNQIQALSEIQVRVSVAGFLLALWGSFGIFGAITSAINHAWGVEKRPSFWKHKLIGFTILAASGLLLMLTLLLVSSVQLAQANWFTTLIDAVPGLAWLRGIVVRNLPTPMFILVIALLYYFVPNAKMRFRDVWPGALIAGVLWRLAFAGFSWYVSDLSRFTVHGQVAAVAVFLVWVYLSAVIFLYGVEVSAAYSRLRLQRTAPPPPRD